MDDTVNKRILKCLGALVFICYNTPGSKFLSTTKRTFTDVFECLQHLKVLILYLQFDLEATRRENVELRKLLKGK